MKPACHLVNSLMKALTQHHGYNLSPASNVLKQPVRLIKYSDKRELRKNVY